MAKIAFEISQAQQEAIEVVLRQTGWDHQTLLQESFKALSRENNRRVQMERINETFEHTPNEQCVPTSFEEETVVFGPPVGMTEEQVYSLCASQIEYDGDPAIVTCWKVTKESLQALQKTGRIWVITTGAGLVPMIVQTDKPFDAPFVKLTAPPIG